STTATALASYSGGGGGMCGTGMRGLLGRRVVGRGQSEAFRSKDDGPRRSEELGQKGGEAHAAALGRTRDAGKDLVGVRAGLRAGAGGHLAHDDSGPDLLLGEVVGGRDGGVVEEDEHLVLVLAEVLVKSPVGRVARRALEEVGELLLRVADRSLPEALTPQLDRELAGLPEVDGLLEQ